ncbi:MULTISPECIES: outer membrane usher protein [Serratia]|nr:outer membrane usher protein [Serratia liquefaciens]MCS4318635.1 outer membrane usher protein FimD/PapC [Serratia sp. BIGb0234]CAI2489769.1 Outer membrane usher protein papC precursor [Serratia liquefaciens]
MRKPTRTLLNFYMPRLCFFLYFWQPNGVVYAVEEIQFNTDVLDLNDRENIDLSQFSRSGYIMPGTYAMTVHVNKNELAEQSVLFIAPENDPKDSKACLSPMLVQQLGLKESILPQLSWSRDGRCLNLHSLEGMEARGDLASSALYLSVPQAYLEFTSDYWDPPSRWDEGIPGILLDYSVNAQTQWNQRQAGNGYDISGNGTLGGNAGAWRLRADWQGRLASQSGSKQRMQRSLEWSRYYIYRAIPAWRAKLTLGEEYLESSLFDSFRFTGLSLRSDDNMLPPNLRGYAPEVTGIAKSNAKVIISQQGRVLYETQVAAGPFRIQGLSDAVSGQLDVRVEEQDGGVVQTFTVNTASIPYLTRPGLVRFKLAAGRPAEWGHQLRGPLFTAGEFSWGVTNGWSLYGGGLGGGDYNALSLGIGRDLMALGALSFDATQSRTQLRQERAFSGSSYRLSYSKTFDELDSQVTFAGYRFSAQDFMTMSEYLDARYTGHRSGSSREMYTVTLNKNFRDWGLSTYLNYNHQTYWNRPTNDRYNLTLSRYFDFGNIKNLSLSIGAYRNRFNGRNEDGMTLSVSMPWGNRASLNYSLMLDHKDTVHRAGYYDRIDEHSSYQLSAGTSRRGGNLSGYYDYEGDIARVSANASYQQGSYSALGAYAQGGMTLTSEGGALHRSNMMGGTRLLIDTNGVSGVPVRGYGSTSRSNRFGKAVVAEVNSYYRNKVSIDLNQLSDSAEAITSVVQATLTEGAIGSRRFDVIAGEKAMAMIRLADGSEPPFGATVLNVRNQETGIVNDGGSVYLSGINAGETMKVSWAGHVQCEVKMPASLPADLLMNNLLLPCEPVGRGSDLSQQSVRAMMLP